MVYVILVITIVSFVSTTVLLFFAKEKKFELALWSIIPFVLSIFMPVLSVGVSAYNSSGENSLHLFVAC